MSIVLVGSTSGSVTLQEPAVAGTTTLNLPAATGTVMVSGNMPAFSAHPSSNQSVTTATSTKMLFQTEVFDTNNNFASSTFTPTVAGYYQFNAYLSPNTAVTRILVMLYKNGSRVNILLDGTSIPSTGGGGTILYLNGTTDYVEVYGRLDGVSPEFNGASDSTYFSGAMVRAA